MNAWGIQSVIDGEGLWRVFLASYAPLFDTYRERGASCHIKCFSSDFFQTFDREVCFGGEYEEEQLTKNIRLEYWLYFFLVLFHMHFCEKNEV